MKTIDVIIPIHYPNYNLLSEVISAIAYTQDLTIKVIDSDTFDLPLSAYNKNIIVQKGYPVPEWEKVKKAYDESTADYVAICAQDDFWLKDKLHEQLKWIDQCGLCITSFIYSYNDSSQKHQRSQRELAIPAIDEYLGLWNCMPSTWLLNKSKLPILPIPYDNGITHCMDQAIAMACSIESNIIALKLPYLIYNDLGNNQTYQVTSAVIKRAQTRLHKYFLEIKDQIKFKVI